MPSGNSTCSRTRIPPNMESEPERRSASSRNPGPMRCTEPFSSLSETARSMRQDHSTREPFLPSGEINSEPRREGHSRKIVCSCSATTKDSGRPWRSAASAWSRIPGAPGLLPNSEHRRIHSSRQSESGDAALHVLLASARSGSELMVPSTTSPGTWFRAGHRTRTTILTSISGKISALSERITTSEIATLFPGLTRSTMAIV